MSSLRETIEFIARGFVQDADGRVLLCRNVKRGYYYLPGGHVEFGESSREALAREFMEETGVKVHVGELIAVHEQVFSEKRRTRHEVNVVFHVERKRKAIVTSLEPRIGFEWVTASTLRSIDLRPAAIRGSIQNWMRRRPSHPEWIPARG